MQEQKQEFNSEFINFQNTIHGLVNNKNVGKSTIANGLFYSIQGRVWLNYWMSKCAEIDEPTCTDAEWDYWQFSGEQIMKLLNYSTPGTYNALHPQFFGM